MSVSNIYRNQKIIQIKKDIDSKENFEYNLLKAMGTLTPNGLKLYIYLVTRNNEEVFPLSRIEACEVLSISKGTYGTIVKELIDKKYLQLIDYIKENDNEIYNFYEKGEK